MRINKNAGADLWAAMSLVLAAATLSCVPGGESRPGLTPGASSDGATGALSAGASSVLKAGTSAVKAPFDVGAVIRRVHFAYRREGKHFAGEHSTYTVRATQGRVALRAIDASAPEARPAVRSSAMQLETVAAGREGAVASVRVRKTRLEAGGRLAMERGAVVEHLTNSDQGVEQSWRLAARPSGSGDLVVRVRATGMSYAGATAKGLHFRDPASGLGFRYSHGTWVDASGARTRVPARWDGKQVVLRVPAKTVKNSAYPAVLDPTISPEIELDTPITGPANGYQSYSSVASDGTDYFVVWGDSRSGTTQVYGARVKADGTVLDPFGIHLTSGITSSCANPSVIFGGGQYMLVFANWTYPYRIYGMRISTAGAVLDPGGFPISPETGSGLVNYPSVAYNGTNYMAAWEAPNSSTSVKEIRSARISTSGTVLDPASILINATQSERAQVASSGSEFLVAWLDYRTSTDGDIYAARVSNSGTLVDTSGIAVCTGQPSTERPAVTYGGSNYLVAWDDRRSIGSRCYAARVSTSGSVLDPNGFVISTGSS